MLGGVSSGLLGSSGLHDGGGRGGSGDLGAGVDGGVSANSSMFGDEDKGRIEEGDRSSAGNRWPRQETLALLKIRSDMDVVFRDSSLKGPLWEDVSRKMAELGYQRSAKKCKEKFENVYKYHKRTKEGRSTKSDGKTYRFFDQLQALDHHHPPPLLPSPPPPTPPSKPLQPPPTTTATAMPAATTHPPPSISHLTVPSTTNPIIPPPSTNPIISYSPVIKTPNIPATQSSINPSSQLPNVPQNFMSNSTSSSTSSDEGFLGRRKKKRKWKDFFQRLMTEVVDKQEELQKRFLEAIEKREHDRMVREEAWKMQEMARLNREHEILVQERSVAAAKDAAVIAFLQKVSDQQINLPPVQVQLNDNITTLAAVSQPQPQPQPQSQPPPQPQQPLAPPPLLRPKALDIPKLDNGDNSVIPSASSSRWPKAEVQALINLRKSLDLKYQENGPKGPLWEEISGGMKKLGYNRNAKRCKEKWENINKYFKKVKESNKQRPEDSKTCPYFHLLDALYKEKNNKIDNTSISSSFVNPSYAVNSNKLDHHHQNPTNNMAPLMVQPEQQWPLIPPPPQSQDQHRRETVVMMEDVGSENNEEGDDEEDDDGDEDDEEDEGGDYEIVSNKQPAANTMGNVE